MMQKLADFDVELDDEGEEMMTMILLINDFTMTLKITIN